MQMEGRHSRNVVFEVARSQTTPSLINLLTSYIRDTDDIKVASGVKIYDPNNHAQLAMVFIMLIKNNQNQPGLAHCISFGPAPHGVLSPRARSAITNA
jgi:aspartate oxidase